MEHSLYSGGDSTKKKKKKLNHSLCFSARPPLCEVMKVLFTSNYCLLPRALLDKYKAQCHLTGFQAIIIIMIIILNTKPIEPQSVNTPHWNVMKRYWEGKKLRFAWIKVCDMMLKDRKWWDLPFCGINAALIQLRVPDLLIFTCFTVSIVRSIPLSLCFIHSSTR